MESLKNESGLTYLSVLFSLSILLTILPFGEFVYKSIETRSYLEELAVAQCFQFIQQETELADKTFVSAASLSFSHYDGSNSSISQYQHIIRRQVSNRGHETLLRDVKQVQFDAMPYGLRIRVTMASGGEYEKKIYLLST